jgi:glycosyltransferase involved in cell wall biosynthesis
MNSFHQILVSNELGGAGLMALHFANFLKGQSRESHVWIPGKGPAQHKAHELGLRCHLYSPASICSRSKTTQIATNWKIGRLLSRYRPGVMHVYSPFHYRVLLLGSKISRLKSIVHIQLEEEEEGLRWAFKTPPDLIITCAKFLVEHVRRTLPERYQRRQRIVAVPNAVDTDRFFPDDKSAAKRRVGAPPAIALVLMLANLAPHKGQETALRVTAVLKEIGVNIALWLAGVERGGEQRYTTYLRLLASELGVDDRVRFLGHRDDTPDLLQAADIFLLPSTLEGLPLSILEAQATKVPVLAAPSSGIPEVVIDGETGFLIAADDVNGYAYHIKSLLDHSALYHRTVEQAYAKVTSDYTFQAYCRKISQLYECLLDPDNNSVVAY